MALEDNFDIDMLRSVFNALPSLVFVVDEDVRIQEFNAAAAEFLSVQDADILNRRGGEVLHCLHSDDVPKGCGCGPYCKDCIIRDSVAKASQGGRVVRRRSRIEINRDGSTVEIFAMITASPFLFMGRRLVLLVIEDMSEIAELRHIIPICAICKNVRDDEESWLRIESYFRDQWDIDFSHGLCPECLKNEMEKLDREIEAGQESSDER